LGWVATSRGKRSILYHAEMDDFDHDIFQTC
jgi:hypothetical protein